MERRELEQLFAFDRWANRQTIEALYGLGEVPMELRVWETGKLWWRTG